MESISILQYCLALLFLFLCQGRTFYNTCYSFICTVQISLFHKLKSFFYLLFFFLHFCKNLLQTLQYRRQKLPCVYIIQLLFIAFCCSSCCRCLCCYAMQIVRPMCKRTHELVSTVPIHKILYYYLSFTLHKVVLYIDTGSTGVGITLGIGSSLLRSSCCPCAKWHF